MIHMARITLIVKLNLSGSIPIKLKIFTILKIIVSTHLKYAKNNGGIYFQPKLMDLLKKGILFR